jgi:uncharacterized membrane protein (DUF4010 family)
MKLWFYLLVAIGAAGYVAVQMLFYEGMLARLVFCGFIFCIWAQCALAARE